MRIQFLLAVSVLVCAGCYDAEQAAVERGYRWITRGETERALSTFAFVIEKNPYSVLAFVGRGDALFESHQDQDAIVAYTEALRLLERAPLDSEKNGDEETVGQRFLSYQNQGLAFPFGVTSYLHVRRGAAYHALGVRASGTERRELLDKADADYSRALEISPRYREAVDAQRRLSEDRKNDRPNQALQPTRMLVTFCADAQPAPSTRVADL